MNKENLDEIIQDELLRTLSFFEPMTLEFIYLDLDDSFLENYPNIHIQNLSDNLKVLEEKKLIKTQLKDEQKYWIKIYQKG